MAYETQRAMVDTVDKATRSKIMSAIRGKNTKPEILLRKALFKRGFRYRIHPKRIIGQPDIVLPGRNVIIFVEGCFWHGHNCGHVRLPSSNATFWADKISRNRARDEKNKRALLRLGWRVCRVWECALRSQRDEDVIALADKVEAWILSERMSGTFQHRKRVKD